MCPRTPPEMRVVFFKLPFFFNLGEGVLSCMHMYVFLCVYGLTYVHACVDGVFDIRYFLLLLTIWHRAPHYSWGSPAGQN